MKLLIRLLLPALLLLSCSRSGAPLIGISTARLASGSDCLSPNYSSAILRAGGIPVIIPTLSSAEEASAIVEKLDGIVFSGGPDIDPAWYGETVLNETVQIDSVRDRSDSLLVLAALASGKPILAICRGEQIVNVLMGGSLYQDIPSQIEGANTHRGVFHKIGLEKESILYRLFQVDSIEVNSRHHQSVKDVAPGLRVTAWSPDGIVEAYENDQVWGVQFHPESMQKENTAWVAFFRQFVRKTARQVR